MTSQDPAPDVFRYASALPKNVFEEFTANPGNGCVGQKVVAENERVRLWMIHLKPGESLPLHKHVKDYFWIALTAGRARSYKITSEGLHLDEFELLPGATKYNKYAAGEFKIHNLENIGTSELIFATCEFADNPNPFLPIPDDRRVQVSDGLISSKRLA